MSFKVAILSLATLNVNPFTRNRALGLFVLFYSVQLSYNAVYVFFLSAGAISSRTNSLKRIAQTPIEKAPQFIKVRNFR